tara:strand:+ start:204 stop:641 length:438 start_codon:yes stop_codon:yes gene_type:complete
LIEKRYNVKPGDMILTDIGSGFLVRETRAYWFYLFKTRMNRIKKAHLWQMIDCGNINIKYAEGKKYRRIQKRFRTLDLRNTPLSDIELRFDEFIDFVNLPCSVVFGRDSLSKVKLVVEKIDELSLEFYEEKSYNSNIAPVIRIVS